MISYAVWRCAVRSDQGWAYRSHCRKADSRSVPMDIMHAIVLSDV